MTRIRSSAFIAVSLPRVRELLGRYISETTPVSHRKVQVRRNEARARSFNSVFNIMYCTTSVRLCNWHELDDVQSRYVDILGKIRQISQTGRSSSGNFRVFCVHFQPQSGLVWISPRGKLSRYPNLGIMRCVTTRAVEQLFLFLLSPFPANIYKEYDVLSLIPAELLITSFTTFIATQVLPHQSHPTYDDTT